MHFIAPNWPAPARVRACTTLRSGGVSVAPYDAFNLAEHVGDALPDVHTNRQLLYKMLDLPNEPIWLEQTHSTQVVPALPHNQGKEADASFTTEAQQVCVVMTADCLPILLCQCDGNQIGAIHAGWRGLANGIIEQTLAQFNFPPHEILAWLGPAIGPQVFEVGDEVRALFLQTQPEAAGAFLPSPQGRWLANLYILATLRLQRLGVTQIFGGDYCTYSMPDKFFSYRRDGNKTGRMASLIWLTAP